MFVSYHKTKITIQISRKLGQKFEKEVLEKSAKALSLHQWWLLKNSIF